MKSDIESLVKIFNNEYENIGLWGISIGGIPTSEMIKMSSFYSKIKFAILDRNFSSIESVIKSTMSELLLVPYKVLLFGSSDNVENYINDLNIKKIIICDANDEIIPDKSSLKAGVANKMITNKFRKTLVSKSSISFLKIFLNDDDYLNFINSIGIIIENKKIITGIDLSDLYSSETFDYNYFYKKLNILDESTNYLLDNTEKENNAINADHTQKKHLGRCGYNLMHDNENYSELKEYIEGFDSCWNLLTNIHSINNKKSKIEFIESFFECLYIFGSYDDILTTKEYLEKIEIDNSCKSFRKNAIEKMGEIITKVQVVICQLNDQENSKYYKEKIEILKSFSNGLKQIVDFFHNNKISSLEDMAIGYLLPVSSGHNDPLKKESLNVLSSFIKSLNLK